MLHPSRKNEIVDQLHKRAQAAVARFKACETELVEVFEQAEKFRAHITLGYSSLFMYATKGLGLSEEVAYIFINVARKVREVPELKLKIRSGEISVSKARRITSVLNQKNQKHWLELASSLSKRELEKMVAAENPRSEIVEKASYVSRDRLQLQLGVSERFMLEARRAQDVISQKKRRPVSLEEVFGQAIRELIERHDPLARAKRQEVKGKLRPELCPGTAKESVTVETTKAKAPAIRKAIPAAIRHKLQIQFGGRCAHHNPDGSRCHEGRFLDVHHIQPVQAGGKNDLNNLELLCTSHHRQRHQRLESRR